MLICFPFVLENMSFTFMYYMMRIDAWLSVEGSRLDIPSNQSPRKSTLVFLEGKVLHLERDDVLSYFMFLC